MAKDAPGEFTYLQSFGGWCAGCGRRRAADGRCPNCDAWWGSPLLQLGGPLILGTLLLLFIGIRALDPSRPSTRPGYGESSAAPMLVTTASPAAATPAAAYASSRSVAALAVLPAAPAPPPPLTGANFAPPPAPEAIQQAQLEHLRFLSHRVDAALSADQRARGSSRAAGPSAARSDYTAAMSDVPLAPY